MSAIPPVNTNYSDGPEESPGKGLAIAAIVCGVIFPLAFIGLILGIIALVMSSNPGKRGARGLAIGGTVTSGIVLFLTCGFGLAGGIMLPALGKARNSARQLQSAAQLGSIRAGLQVYAQNSKDQLPPMGSDWQTLLTQQELVPSSVFVSPASQGSATSYFYVPPGKPLSGIKDPAVTVLVFEDPANFRHRSSNVLFVDGHIEFLTSDALWPKLEGLKLVDGTVYHKPATAR